MKTVSRAIKASCAVAVALCLSGWALPAAQAQVMSQVPSDALVVIKVNKLQATNTKVASLLQTLGLTDLVPTLKDPLASLKTQSGMGPGIDTQRDAAAVILNGKFGGPGAPPPFVLLLPISDYKEFLTSVTVVRTEGDVTVAHFKDNEEDAFVESWGEYAAISDKKENVTGKHDGMMLKGATARQMDEKDLCIYVNFPGLKPLLAPKLQETPDRAMEELGKTQTDANKIKLAKVAITQLVAAATEFLNDAQGAAIGISISDGGISSNMVVDLAPDSYLGKAASAMKSTDQPLLSGLPKENYLMFGGFVQDPMTVGKVIEDLVSPVTKELAGMGDDGKKANSAIDAYRDIIVAPDSASFGMVAPTAALGQGPLFRILAVYKGDIEKLKSGQTKMYEAQNQLMELFGTPGGDLLKTTTTPNFKTINGVKFDRVQTEVNPDNTSQQAMQLNDQMRQDVWARWSSGFAGIDRS